MVRFSALPTAVRSSWRVPPAWIAPSHEAAHSNAGKRPSPVPWGVRGCEHFSLGVFAGFAGVLVSLAGLDTCGLSLSGLSSSGKTTAQKLAVSAWSRAVNHRRDSLLQSGRTTLNGVESAAAQSAGTILALDELAHIPGKELSNFIYTLAGGVGKRRMATDTSLRESCSWSTFVLLSAEASLAEKTRGDGASGQPARLRGSRTWT